MGTIKNIESMQLLLGNLKRLGMFFPQHCKKAVILAPHPDDETIGCGGIISKYNNIQMDMISVLLTYKEENSRGLEFVSAMKELNCEYQLMELEDGKLESQKEEMIVKLQQLIDMISPDIIFTPYLFDMNRDHKVVSESLVKIEYSQKTLIAMYEVWTPILYPNYYIDISNQNEIKCRAMQCYQSQESQYHLIGKAQKLNGLRAELLMRKNTTHMEAFKVFDSCQFQELIHSLKIFKLL
jgi:LmbE family N-acetylglucosaminyl deacetylase